MYLQALVLRFFLHSIVGHVAVIGKHRCICADNQVAGSGLSFEFSLCIEDLILVAIGRYLKALIATMCHYQTTASSLVRSSDNVLERMFALLMEQGSLWQEICSLPEIEGSVIS
ncbi:hypothetical protein GLYMA_11G174000v4 [Glycine max]|nr:hypothetical protein GLYMA_11G174000v4 [Glycine max]KAH1159860.1 hypothetical protein GYH30_031560 [Glycine max]